ncbi:hypothetical protein [Escherichia coli]|nr:hypothetical protein [Escherichia coli]
MIIKTLKKSARKRN